MTKIPISKRILSLISMTKIALELKLFLFIMSIPGLSLLSQQSNYPISPNISFTSIHFIRIYSLWYSTLPSPSSTQWNYHPLKQLLQDYLNPDSFLPFHQLLSSPSSFPSSSFAASHSSYLSSLPSTLPYTSSFSITLARRLLLSALDPRVSTAQVDLIEAYKCIVHHLYKSNMYS